MMQWMKYVLGGLMTMFVVLWMYYYTTLQTQTIKESADVQGILRSSLVGHPRSDGVDGGVNKDELIGNLVEDVVKNSHAGKYISLKNQETGILDKMDSTGIKIGYTFLDENLNPTEDNEKIDSIQFVTEVWTKEGKVKLGNATRRISLNMVSKRVADAKTLKQEFYFGMYGEPDNEVEVEIPGIKKIVGVSTIGSGGGTATVVEDEDSLDSGILKLKLSGGNKIQKLSGVEVGDVQEKEITIANKQTSSLYADSAGYTGILQPELVDGSYQLAGKKYISYSDKQSYSDSDGYSGTLTELPKETETVNDKVTLYGVPNRAAESIMKGYVGYEDKLSSKKYITLAKATADNSKRKFDWKYITNWATNEYKDSDGYEGNLRTNITVRTEPKTVKVTYKDTNISDSNIPKNKELFEKNGSFGRSYGMLTLSKIERSSETKEVEEEKVVSNVVANTDSAIEESKPDNKVTGNGYWKQTNKYTAIRVSDISNSKHIFSDADGETLSGDGDDYDDNVVQMEDVNGNNVGVTLAPGLTTTKDFVVASPSYEYYSQLIGNTEDLLFPDTTTSVSNQQGFKKYSFKGYSYNGSLEDFVRTNTGKTYIKLPTSKVEEVAVVEWTWVHKEPKTLTATYTGSVEVLTYNYEGYVFKDIQNAIEGVDYEVKQYYDLTLTRNVTGDKPTYSGWVTRPERDTRLYYYVGTVTKVGSVLGNTFDEGYGYRVVVEYEPEGQISSKPIESEEDDESGD